MKLFIILLLFATTANCLGGSKESKDQSYESAHFKFIGRDHSKFKELTKNKCVSKIREAKYFNRSMPSVLIIHGIETDYKSEYARTMVSAFVSRGEHNVIFGDWSAYAFDDYSDMAHDVDHIAQVFVDLLNKMRDDKYDLTKVYIVGHSLGAHIAGKIGRILQHQAVLLPRITGLDPTGPYFNHPRWKQQWMKYKKSHHKPLSRDDASFVDIIHSNAGLYRGVIFSTGHLDFWPNCGIFQPHCDECKFWNILSDWKQCSLCSHVASWRYYVESVKSKAPVFEAERCKTKILMRFFCNGEKTYMGYYASTRVENGDYYLKTNSDSPYSK